MEAIVQKRGVSIARQGARGSGMKDPAQMPTVVVGDFEWDVDKAATNERKHGVAMTAFLDERGIAARDTEHPGRFVLIGMSRALRVLFVVSAETGERVRLISARKASPTQRKMYENGP
jgi:uncharacterized DUF497 family protein